MKLRSIGVLTLANGTNALLAFAVSVVAARLLPAEEFGRLSVMMATSAFLVLSLDFGMNQILTSRVALRKATNLFSGVLRVRVLFALASSLAGFLTLCVVAARRDDPFSSAAAQWTVLVVSSAWQVVFTTEQSLTQGRQAFRRLAVQLTVVNAIRLVCVGIAALTSPRYEHVVAAYLLPSFVAGVGTTVQHRSRLRERASYRLLKKLLPTIGLAGLTVCLTSVLSRLGIWAVALLAGNAAAGTYAVAFQAATLVLTFSSALSLSFLPHVARLDKQNAEGAYGFFRSYLRKALPVLALLIFGAAAFSLLVPHVFGPRYAGTFLPTFLLMTAFLASAMNSPFYLFQVSRLRYLYLAKVHVAQIGLMAAACWALIPRFGAEGAAMAEIFMRITVVGVFVWQALTELKRDRLLQTESP
jgi:O-antigen/teichoic acid export membrane protein